MRLDLDDDMPQGKYVGELVVHVMNTDLDYLRWFVENVDHIEFEEWIVEALYNKPSREELLSEFYN